MSNVYVTMNIPSRKIWCHIATNLYVSFLALRILPKLGRETEQRSFYLTISGNEFMCSYSGVGKQNRIRIEKRTMSKNYYFGFNLIDRGLVVQSIIREIG